MKESVNNYNYTPLVTIVSVIGVIIIISPYLTYSLYFHNSVISTNNQDWANFGSFIGGVLSPLVAIGGIFITLLIYKMSDERNNALKKRQEMAQKPLLHIYTGDWDNLLKVSLINRGIGTLIIKAYEIVDISCEGKKYKGFFEIFKSYDNLLNQNTGNLEGYMISPNEEKDILLAKNPYIDDAKTKLKHKNKHYIFFLKKLRNTLKKLEIRIIYKDIYGNDFEATQKLDWYGRTESNCDIEVYTSLINLYKTKDDKGS